MNKKKRGFALLLIGLTFLCLSQIVFAGGETDIVGDANVEVGQAYEYSLSNLNDQENEIIWYIQDNIQGVSIENRDGYKKAKIYINNNVNVKSFELIVKIKSKEQTIVGEKNTATSEVQEKIVSKVIQVKSQEDSQSLKKMKSADGVIITDVFKDTKLAEYMRTYYDLDNDGNLNEEEIDKVKLLNLSDSGISSLEGIEYLDKLMSLTLTGVQVTHIDVSMFNQLTSVTCNRVPLTSLVINNNSIEVLKVNNSQLTTINFNNSAKLRSIDCSQNSKLSSLVFPSQNVIASLTCTQTAMTSLDLSSLSLLTEINCGNNAITTLDLSHNPLIQYVTTSNCGTLSSIDVTKCPELLWLYAGTNALAELDVTKNPKLTILIVPSNSIRSIDLTNNIELKNLDLMQNCLSSLDVSQNTKLAQYSSLGNQRIDVQFQYDKNLRKWISQPILFLDNKVFSGTMFTSASNPITYDDLSKCFVVDKASQMGLGTMQSTFTLPANGKIAKLNANINFEFVCHVQYETCGGMPQPEKVQLSFGDSLQEPTKPTKTGYLFEGWYKDEAKTQQWDFENDTVDGDLTLYAKWNVQTFTVRFHNAYDTSLTSQTVEYQGSISEPVAKPVKDYQFMGWYTDNKYQNRWDFTTNQVTSDIDLYAYYKEVVKKPQSNMISNTQIDKGSQVVLTCATLDAKIYYTVDGTKPTNQSQLYTKPITVNSDITITAVAIKEGCVDSDIVIYRYTVMNVGNVDVVIKVEGEGNITVGEHQDILDAVLNDKDYEEYKKGNDIVITLECQLLEGKKEEVNDSIIKGYQVGGYLDISVFKQIGTKDKEKVTELNQPIQITIDIPEELLPTNGKKRIYSILRIHNNEQTILSDRDLELKTITIESDKFSTYIILYQDEKTNGNIQNSVTKTNDDTKYFSYCVLATVSFIVIVISKRKLKN